MLLPLPLFDGDLGRVILASLKIDEKDGGIAA